ncbi:deleted in malignant brain tumors 1 protein-like [Acanthaster planci]|uniref:Deleted in malignant brain tumors 1 protein-like n=1 Tax=Acanthaster planci TaxID=133434 RepID=A0A8B7Y6Z6_ACAPL|nr:deleted in malignant brain tumors 1 protein-like [Acanthaster planci]
MRPHDGRVEVFVKGNWSTVCDDDWDAFDAVVICRQLGYNGALMAKGSAAFGQGSGQILLSGLQCTGSEKHLAECLGATLMESNCNHNEDAGVVCYDQRIRLVDGSSTAEGRVEVFADKNWGTVCGDGWSLNNSIVACRQLGFLGATEKVASAAVFGPGDSNVPVLLNEVACTGGENSIFECGLDRRVSGGCSDSDDAGVRCEVDGRVELFLQGDWGTICDDSWNLLNANVVCRQLGFTQAVLFTSFGAGAEEMHILMDEVMCRGDEDSAVECPRTLGSSDCSHAEDVGVHCDNSTTDDIATDRLVDGSDSAEGRVEIFALGTWGTICDDNWDITDANVVCHQAWFSWGCRRSAQRYLWRRYPEDGDITR